MKLRRENFSEFLDYLLLDIYDCQDLSRDLSDSARSISTPLSLTDTHNTQTLERLQIKLEGISEAIEKIQQRIEDPRDFLRNLKYNSRNNFH